MSAEYLPNCQLSERVILGAALQDNTLMRQSIAQLSIEDFALASHRELFAIMLRKAEDSTPFDICTLTVELQQSGKLVEVGGAAYVTDLTSGVIADEGLIREHVAKVRESAIRRRMLATLTETEAKLLQPGNTANLILQHRERVAEIVESFDQDGNLNPNSTSSLKLVRGSAIADTPREWLVPDFLPASTLTLVVGAPGVGKTTAMLSMLADLTRGKVPIIGGHRKRSNVFMLSSEDAASDIKRNFERVGGDPERLLVEDCSETTWTLRDCEGLEAMIEEHRPEVVVIDSLYSHAPAKVDLYKHSEAADLLVRLRKLAEQHSCALVLIHHTNKSQSGDPLVRTSGSQGIIATCRHSLLIAQDPDDEDMRVCVVQKTNLGRLKPAYRFTLDPFGWAGSCEMTANELSQQFSTSQDAGVVCDAVEFLRNALESGPQPSKEIEEQARANGISMSALRRAKKKAGVISRKEGSFSGRWVYCIEDAREVVEDAHVSSDGHLQRLRENEHISAASQVGMRFVESLTAQRTGE